MAGQGLHDQDVERTAVPATSLRRGEESLRQFDRGANAVLGAVDGPLREQQPRHGRVLELAHVGQVVVCRESVLPRPPLCLRYSALAQPHPGQCGIDWTYLWRKITEIDAMSLSKKLEGAGGIAASQPDSCSSHARAVWVLR